MITDQELSDNITGRDRPADRYGGQRTFKLVYKPEMRFHMVSDETLHALHPRIRLNSNIGLNYFSTIDSHRQPSQIPSLYSSNLNNSANRRIEVKETNEQTEDDTTDNGPSKPTKTFSGKKHMQLHNVCANYYQVNDGFKQYNIFEISNNAIRPPDEQHTPIAAPAMEDSIAMLLDRSERGKAGLTLVPSVLLDQVRETQRYVRQQIRGIERQIEVLHDQGKDTSADLDKMRAEIAQLKSAAINEAEYLEEKHVKMQPVDSNYCKEASQIPFTQRDRIRCIKVLGGCERDLRFFCETVKMDFDLSAAELRQEILRLEKVLTGLAQYRRELILLKIRYIDTQICRDVFAASEANKDRDITNVDTYDCKDFIKHSLGQEINIKTTLARRPPYVNVLSHSECMNRRWNIMEHQKSESSQGKSMGTCRDVKPDPEYLFKLRHKWENLDEEYRKHAEAMMKQQAENEAKCVKAVPKPMEKISRPVLSKPPTTASSPKLPEIKIGQTLREKCKMLKHSIVDMGVNGGKRIELCSKSIVDSKAYQGTMDEYRLIDDFLFENNIKLRSGVSNLCEAMQSNFRTLRDSVHNASRRVAKCLNSLNRRRIDMKRQFRQYCREDIINDTKIGTHFLRRISVPVSTFFRRIQLVGHFRNALLFDREILLPVTRSHLYEWYDQPLAVVYGIKRFETSHGHNRRRSQHKGRSQMDHVFDVRLYGPMEYQLGRPLDEGERALLEGEKIALLRKVNRDKQSKNTNKPSNDGRTSQYFCLGSCFVGNGDDIESEESETDSEATDEDAVQQYEYRDNSFQSHFGANVHYQPNYLSRNHDIHLRNAISLPSTHKERVDMGGLSPGAIRMPVRHKDGSVGGDGRDITINEDRQDDIMDRRHGRSN